ncbi:asparaginase domain-containing protein [Leucobacter chromiireducens]|uniref:asparaginase domain-containing protein n=1 Tax=Leucobacter chromiireducens TaxID=283877 RepID=UPI0013DDFCE0|nr:asparaginase domain-containing protein [Leucobacter chromiireducens]
MAILYTGGTFGMAPTASGLAPHPHLRAEIERLAAAVGEAGGAPLTWSYAETERAIDSAEAGPESLARLSDRIRELVDRERPDGVLVIHGTDTMAYTAAYAAFALADLALPIVFTGSQVPLSAAESDAPRNFSQALSAAGGPLAAGVWIAFDGLILPAVRAVKRSSESFSAFAAPRGIAAGALGVAPQLAAALRGAAGRVGPRVGLVKVTPGLNAAQLAAALDACPAGVVLEGYGAGTAPVVTGGLAAPVRAAAERGTAILVTTQCTDGAVALGRYAVGSELAAAGATGAGDMTAEAALGKLAALVRAGYAGEELERLLTANLIGERLG